jgi:ParB/RepB/Spo0J family partition protein
MAHTATRAKPTASSGTPDSPDVIRVALADIDPHPRNPRHQLGDLTDLAASIGEVGVLQPLVIVHAPTGGTPYWVLAGHRRYAAAQLAVLAEVPCLLREDLDTPDRQLAAMLVENLHRADLTPVEEGQAYEQLMAFGYTVKKIAGAVSRSPATVRGRSAIARLPEKIRDRVQDRQITLDEAAGLAEFAGDRRRLAQLALTAGTRDFATTLQRARSERDQEKAARKSQAELTRAGVRLVKRVAYSAVEVEPGRPSVAVYGLDLSRVLHGVSGYLSPEELAEHAACPGHAAVDPVSMVAYNEPLGRVWWLCLQPGLHRPERADDAAGDDEEPEASPPVSRVPSLAEMEARQEDAAELEQQEQAAAKLREDEALCEAARQVRGTFILALTSETGEMPRTHVQLVSRFVVASMAVEYFGDVTPELWVGMVDPDTDEDVEDVDVRAVRLAGCRDPHRVLLAIAAAEDEQLLVKPAWWAPGPLRAKLRWLDLLAALGWEASSWELERIQAARALQAEKDAEADPATVVCNCQGPDEDGVHERDCAVLIAASRRDEPVASEQEAHAASDAVYRDGPTGLCDGCGDQFPGCDLAASDDGRGQFCGACVVAANDAQLGRRVEDVDVVDGVL